MSERNYWVYCDDHCKFPAMTKEQTLAAIAQAVSTGEIKDVDAGFISKLKTINGTMLRFFVGTQAEYEALPSEDKNNLFAIITNDTTKVGIETAIETLQNELTELSNAIADGSFIVNTAKSAPNKGTHTEADEVEGKAFTFHNTNGFGTNDGNSYWRVWDIGNDDTGFYCYLVPSTVGKQGIGTTALPLEEVHAVKFYGNLATSVISPSTPLTKAGLYSVAVKYTKVGQASAERYSCIMASVPDLSLNYIYPVTEGFRVDFATVSKIFVEDLDTSVISDCEITEVRLITEY